MRKTFYAILPSLAALTQSANAQLLISEWLANPQGTDSPFEYVELLATEAIDFSATPFSVVWANNGTATSSGWIAGGGVTYGFSITSGTVGVGDVVYVGGSSMAPTGTRLRVLNTANTTGDGFGAFATGGVLGNGGGSADGMAVFNVGIGSLTPVTVPIDAIFFGTGLGGTVVNGGLDGYQLPVNDLYSGGKLQSTSFFTIDPPGGTNVFASGVFNSETRSWNSARSFALGPLSDGSSGIAVVPEPSGLLAVGGLALLALHRWRQRK